MLYEDSRSFSVENLSSTKRAKSLASNKGVEEKVFTAIQDIRSIERRNNKVHRNKDSKESEPETKRVELSGKKTKINKKGEQVEDDDSSETEEDHPTDDENLAVEPRVSKCSFFNLNRVSMSFLMNQFFSEI